eukprot:gene1379-1742_t
MGWFNSNKKKDKGSTSNNNNNLIKKEKRKINFSIENFGEILSNLESSTSSLEQQQQQQQPLNEFLPIILQIKILEYLIDQIDYEEKSILRLSYEFEKEFRTNFFKNSRVRLALVSWRWFKSVSEIFSNQFKLIIHIPSDLNDGKSIPQSIFDQLNPFIENRFHLLKYCKSLSIEMYGIIATSPVTTLSKKFNMITWELKKQLNKSKKLWYQQFFSSLESLSLKIDCNGLEFLCVLQDLNDLVENSGQNFKKLVKFKFSFSFFKMNDQVIKYFPMLKSLRITKLIVLHTLNPNVVNFINYHGESIIHLKLISSDFNGKVDNKQYINQVLETLPNIRSLESNIHNSIEFKKILEKLPTLEKYIQDKLDGKKIIELIENQEYKNRIQFKIGGNFLVKKSMLPYTEYYNSRSLYFSTFLVENDDLLPSPTLSALNNNRNQSLHLQQQQPIRFLNNKVKSVSINTSIHKMLPIFNGIVNPPATLPSSIPFQHNGLTIIKLHFVKISNEQFLQLSEYLRKTETLRHLMYSSRPKIEIIEPFYEALSENKSLITFNCVPSNDTQIEKFQQYLSKHQGVVALASALRLNKVLVAHVADTPKNFLLMKKSNVHEFIDFKILLKQQNLDKLEKIFWEVSDPQSSSYGKFLNKEDMDALVGAPAESVEIVTEWILKSGIARKNIQIHADFIHVSCQIGKAAALFEADFYQYKSRTTNLLRNRVYGKAVIPFHINEHIDFVIGIADFIEDRKMEQSIRQTNPGVSATSATINPQAIRKIYNVPSNLMSTNDQNFQSIAAFSDYFASGALTYFDQQMGISSNNVRVKTVGKNCLAQQCDQYESDLDIQYITSIGANTTTLFIVQDQGKWVLDWALQIGTFQPMPMISSISYGFYELDQCELTSGCQSLGINSQQYVGRSNTEFQKLGVQGMTIFVSSGDDGAPSFYGASGNCPIANTPYCPVGGCQYTSTQCSEITVTSPKGVKCFFPMGNGGDACQQILQNQKAVTAINNFIAQNSKTSCKAALDQDQQQNYNIHTQCQCSDLKPLTFGGFTVEGYSYDPSNGAIFAPDYPTSSPYVTSVGATQVYTSGQEVVCSVATGAIITGGGGFSTFQPQPSYQTQAVAKFLQQNVNLPPSNSYNSSNRAYPDITLVGHNYQIAVTKDQTSNQCPCVMTSVDGTSCSSPTVAGIFTLINDQLLNSGKTQLGFLNPLLYQAAQQQPNVFNDITSGNINCNRAYCCEYGYSATQGWDPASGHGSINYQNMVNYVMSVKN